MNNSYTRRKVATKDQKPCLICSKPTTTVLYNQSGPDWLYTCDLHLEDNPHFVTRVYSEAYSDTLRELEGVRRELEKVENLGRNSRASWDVWVSKIFDSRAGSADTSSGGSNSNSNSNTTDTKTSPTTTTTTESTATATAQSSLQQRYNALLDRLAELRRQEQGRRNYKLSEQMFEYRLLRRQQRLRQLAKRRQEAANYSNTDPDEIAAKFQFPEVPRGKV